MNDKVDYLTILTADVRYSKALSAFEKLLYSEITALINKDGYCCTTNAYFAQLFDVNKNSISRNISNLRQNGFINIENIYVDNTFEIKERRIYPIHNNLYKS